MFFPFKNYKKVDVNWTGSPALLYTTTSKSMIAFEPKEGTNTSTQAHYIYADEVFTNYDPVVWARWGGNHAPALNPPIKARDGEANDGQGTVSNYIVIPSGTEIKAAQTVGGLTIVGTLHIFELPE